MTESMIWTRGQQGLLEEEAFHATRLYQPGMVPGLLQTSDYARRVGALWTHIPGDPKEHHRIRMERGRQLRENTGLEHQFILSTHVHDHRPGSPVMEAQRAHLAAVDALDHIQIRIRPEQEVPTCPNGFTLWKDRPWIEVAIYYIAQPGDFAEWEAELQRLWGESIPLAEYRAARS